MGKWEATEGKEKGTVLEFDKDGTLSITMAFLNLKAKYKFIDDNTIEMGAARWKRNLSAIPW